MAGRSFAAGALVVVDRRRRRAAAGDRLVERLAGDDAAHLVGVEHFARQQRVGDVQQRAACARQERRARARSCRVTMRFTSWSILSAVSSL